MRRRVDLCLVVRLQVRRDPPAGTTATTTAAHLGISFGLQSRPGLDRHHSDPPAQECPVLALYVKVAWQGSSAVKTLVVGWKPKSASCSQPPLQNPICTLNSCSFDTSQVVTKVDLTLCYGVAAVDSSGNSVIKDPRLIIRGRV